LQYQLYKYAVSGRCRRGILWIYIWLLFFLLAGYALVYFSGYNMPIYLTAAAVCLFGYPFYYRKTIERHFRKYIAEYLLEKTKHPVSLEITGGALIGRDRNGEGRLKISSIQQVTEIKSCYFIELDKASSYVLSKNSETAKFVRVLTDKHGVKLAQNLRWKW
jgi:hypothetical protein